MRYLLGLAVLVIPGTIAAQNFTSRTCSFWNATEYCEQATASTFLDGGLPPEDAPSLRATFEDGPWDSDVLRPTLFAFYLPTQVTPLVPTVSFGGWTGADTFSRLPWSWTDYHLLAGISVGTDLDPADRWAAALEGLTSDANYWSRFFETTIPPGMLWAWRAESEDGSVVLECFQDPEGGEECVSMTPEPATWVLLLSGLAVLVLFARRSRRVELSA